MKKLINRPDAVVSEMVEGLLALYPGLSRLPGRTVLVRSDIDAARKDRVALISGGGSGHEPAHAGYVGRGMLSAAVAGEVFTSPSPDAVHAAIRATAGPRGALLIVKNYTGDRLNFGLAAERARAEGIPVEVVIVGDDVAVAGATAFAGRRGLAGTVLVHKIAGAAAEAGLDLAGVAEAARAAAKAVRTMGVALSPCTLPAAGKPGFDLGPGEVELGLGIHGEPGVRRGPIEPADALVENLLGAILDDAPIEPGRRVVLLVNNLGATPAMELAIVARRAIALLEARGAIVERAYAGTFLSALEMAGVSLSVLPVDDQSLGRLDAPTEAPAWPNTVSRPRRPGGPVNETPATGEHEADDVQQPRTLLGQTLDRAIRAACGAILDAAPRLTDLDRAVGDGDLGISLARGAEAVLAACGRWPLDRPDAVLYRLGMELQRSLGGTSGPLYGIFFLRAAHALKDAPADWAAAFAQGTRAVAELGGAGSGDRTMLDALLPASEALARAFTDGLSPGAAAARAAEAAEAGADATARLSPRLGRSSYLGDRALGHPDPGAVAGAVWLKAIAEAIATPVHAS